MTGNSEIIHSHIRALLRTSATHNCCNQALAVKTRVNECNDDFANGNVVTKALAETTHRLSVENREVSGLSEHRAGA